MLGGGDGSAGSTGSRWPFNDTSLRNALDATTLLSIDNDDEVESGMNVIDNTMDNEDNWDFEDDEILHSTTIMKSTTDENNIDKISHPQPQQQFVPLQQSILHNDNGRQVADNYYGKDDNSNNSLSPINSNHEKGETLLLCVKANSVLV